MFVASVIPACPLPCANADEKAIRMANEKKILFLVIVNCFNQVQETGVSRTG
jgi:hypothetical protein